MKCNIVDYIQLNDLPRLAWIARVSPSNKVTVYHGRNVELHDNWFVEGVWDGEFGLGDFHKSFFFFGTGMRVSDDGVYFTTSSAINVRLLCCRYGNDILVSNSLIILLAYTNAGLDEEHDYNRECSSIVHSVNSYDRKFRVLHPDIEYFQQVFFENIFVSNGEMSFEQREHHTQVKSYEDYIEQLMSILYRIRDNYEDKKRRFPVDAFATISSGYDSAAVACLVKSIGVTKCFTSRRSNSALPLCFTRATDDGSYVGRKLGMSINYLELKKSNVSEQNELFFLAKGYRRGDGYNGIEIVTHSMIRHIEENCNMAVVFYGDHGDVMWDTNTPPKCLVDDIVCTDLTGSSYMEIRLKSGFVPIPVPMILARNILDTRRITFSDEMKPWRMNNNYDRPIPRRIIETSGIERGKFAQRKKAFVSMVCFPNNRQLRKRFGSFLKQRYGLGRLFILYYRAANGAVYLVKRLLGFIFKIRFIKQRAIIFSRRFDIPFIMSLWAVHLLRDSFVPLFQSERDSMKKKEQTEKIGINL